MTILRTRELIWNAHLQARRFVEAICRYDHASSSRKSTSIFRATSALDRGSLKGKKGGKHRLTATDDLSPAELLLRTLISVNRAKYQRSDLGWVWWICSANLRSFVFQHDETRGQYEWTVRLSTLTWSRVNLNEFVFDQRSGTGNPVTKSQRKIRNASRGHTSDSSWRNPWFFETISLR